MQMINGTTGCLLSISMLLASCATHESEPLKEVHHATLGCAVSPSDLEAPGVKAHFKTPGIKGKVVLEGAFDKEGPFEAIWSYAPNTRIPAHYHGGNEEAVVISGGLYMGDMSAAKPGEVMDTSVVQFHRKGERHFVPAKVVHWLFTKDEPAVLKICADGPFTTYYVERLK